MALLVNDGVNNVAVDAVTTNLTTLNIYSGTQPETAGGDDSASTLLATIDNIIFTSSVNGSAGLYSADTGAGLAAGTAGWGRLYGNDGTSYVIDGGCGTASTNVFSITPVVVAVDMPIMVNSISFRIG